MVFKPHGLSIPFFIKDSRGIPDQRIQNTSEPSATVWLDDIGNDIEKLKIIFLE